MEEQEALLGQHGSPKGKSSKHSLQLIPPSTLENKVYQGGGSDQDDRSKAKVPFDIAEAFSMHPEGGPTQVGPMHPPKKVPLTHYDQLLPFLGSFGLWQAMSVGILLLPALAAGMLLVLHNFTTLEPNGKKESSQILTSSAQDILYYVEFEAYNSTIMVRPLESKGISGGP